MSLLIKLTQWKVQWMISRVTLINAGTLILTKSNF